MEDTAVVVKLKPGQDGVVVTEDVEEDQRLCFFHGREEEANVRVRIIGVDSGELAIVDAAKVFAALKGQQEDANVRILAHPTKNAIVKGFPEGQGANVGQFVNDAVRPKLAPRLRGSQIALKEYQNASMKAANCTIKEDLWFYSTRKIKSGEELFTHFGVQHWVQKLAQQMQDPEGRYLCYSLRDQSTLPFDLRRFLQFDQNTCRAFLKEVLGLTDAEVDVKDVKRVILNYANKVGILD